MRRLYRVGRYAQVGLVCAVLNNVIVICLDQAGYHYAVSVIAAFVIVMIVSYLLHSGYTFGVTATYGGWLRFTGGNMLGIPLAMTIMFLLCDVAGLSASAAMPIATVALFAWNFALARWLIGADGRSRA